MRAFVLWSGLGLGLVLVATLPAACALTTDLGALSAGDPSDGGGPGVDASVDAAIDAPDAAVVDAGTDYRAVVLADRPVAYYRFEDPADANSAHDEVGTHDAVVGGPGATFATSGMRGSAITLDGKTSLDVGDAFDFAGKVAYTLEAWVKTSSTGPGDQLVFTKRAGSGDAFRGYILYLPPDRSAHYEAWGADVNMSAWTETPLPLPGFVHVVLTVSYANGKGNAAMFVNGQRAGKGGYDNVANVADTAEPLRIGPYFVGQLDEVALYDRALEPARILAHYRAGTP